MRHQAKFRRAPVRKFRRSDESLNVELLEPRLTPAALGAGDFPMQSGPAPLVGELMPTQQPTTLAQTANSDLTGFTAGFGGVTTDPRYGYPSFATPGFVLVDPFSRFARFPNTYSNDPLALYWLRNSPTSIQLVQRQEFNLRINRIEDEIAPVRLGRQLQLEEHAFLNVYRIETVNGREVSERVAILAIDDGDTEAAEQLLRTSPAGKYRLVVEDRSGARVIWTGNVPALGAEKSELDDAFQRIREHIENLRKEDDAELHKPAPTALEQALGDANETAWSEQVERLAEFIAWVEV